MDEKALEVAYRLFVKDGYNKSIGDFKTLISTNPKALDVSHKLFVKDGYNGDISKYKNLLGVGELETIGTPEIKKKEQVTELPSTDGSLGSENATKPLPKKGVSLGSEKPKPEAPIPNINDNSYGDVQPKPLEFRPFVKDKPILKPTQQVTPKQDLQNRLKTITPELIGKEEKFVVPELNYQFKDQGFKFEEATPMADAMNVTAPNGKVLKIDLDPFTTSGEVMESNKLKKFISENSIDYDKINKVSQQQSEYKKRFIDQKEIESANQRFNDEIKLFDYELQQLNLLQKGTPEYTKKANELAIAQNKLISNQKELNKSAGKYVEMKESQGTYLGYLRNQLIGGITGAASGLAGLVLDVSALPDAAKKQGKAFIQPGIRESLDYFKDETTKEYAESLNFVGEAIGGLVQSLPAMLAGEGLPIIMASQISDGLDQEMKTNPDFENVSELEKLALKTPMIVGGALLEKYGLRNVVQSRGLLNNIVLNAVGKSSKNTTVKSFEDFLEQEIKDKFTRGVLKVGAGGLAEFETGASQELLDITTKDIYNAVKEKKMFQTPETFGEKVGQVFKAGLQEAIGGFILSVPSAISASKGDYTKLNNATIDVLKATGNDATIGQMIETDLKMKVNSGDLTPDEAETQLNDFRESVGVLNSINTEGMTPEQMKRALPIAKKLRDLKNRTDGKVNQTEADKFAINELKVSLDKITNEVKGQTPVADLIDKKVSFQGEEGVIVKDEGGKLTFETPNKIIELQGDEMANAIALPKIEVKGNNVKIDDELFNILSTNKNDNGDVVSVTLRNKEGQVITNKDADLATEISKQFKNKKDAIQEQTTEESVLRNQQPEMGLQEMGEGDTQKTPEQGKTEEEVGSAGEGGDVKLEKGNKIQWNVFGNEESGEWTVGEKTKTRGGKDAVVLTKVYVEASSDGKSYTKEYADANGIKYDNERTVEHIVPLEDLQSLKEAPKTEEIKPFSIGTKTKFYHATPSKVEGKLTVSNAPQFGTGIYLASDKKTVEGEFGDNVMELELNLSNPVYTNTKNWNEVESEAIRLADEEYGKKNNLTLDEDDTYFRYDPENLSEIDEIPSKHISDAAKKLGYDAIIDKGSRTYGDEIVVLDESKIIYPKPIKKQNNETENGIQKRGTQGNENVPSEVQSQREKRGEDVNVPESKTKEEVKPTELQTKISSLQDKIETIKKGKEGKSQILQKIADTAISDLQKKLNILINKQNEAETKAKAKAKKADVLKGKPKSAVVETAAEKVKEKPVTNPRANKGEDVVWKDVNGRRGQGTVISVSKVGNSFEYEIKTKQGAVTTKKHSEIKKKGIGVLANTVKKYSNLDVLTPRTLILRYFATGGKVLYGTKQQDGALSQTGYTAEDLFGFVSKNGRTYSQLYENIMDELQLEDFDQGDFNTMVSEILQGGKQSVYDEIKTHLVGEAKDLDDPINWSYNELLEVVGNENFPNREWVIEQIGEMERSIQDELTPKEAEELDRDIEKYTIDGVIDWEAIANDKEIQKLNNEINEKQNTETESTTKRDSTPISQEENDGQQEIENIKENESNYILTPNKDLPFLSESGNDNYPTKGNVQREEDNSQGYSRSVIGVWNKTKDLQFTGTTKVRNAEDVAHIMRLLENKNVEHGFAVHVDAKGNSHIQYLSVGGTTGTVIDSRLVLAGLAKFKSKKVYLVHNHPSGALVPSKPDISITQTLQSALGKLDIDLEHVIMDTYSNKYVLLDKDADFTVEDRNKDLKDNSNLTVYAFNEQKVISVPQTKVTSSKTAAEFIQQLRFTAMPKNAMLLLSQNNDIIGNYVFKDKITYQECVDFIGKSGIGTSVIFYGNQQRESDARKVSDFLKNMSINVLDHIITDSNGSDVVGYYKSLAEEGMLEETQVEYGTNSVETYKTNILLPRLIKDTNVTIKKQGVEGKLLNEQEVKDLKKEIISKRAPKGKIIFGQRYLDDNGVFREAQDIRRSMFNYDNPYASKNINGIDVRIADGLIRKNKDGKKYKTYLLYADGKIVGEFNSVADAKSVVGFIEDNLVKELPVSKQKELAEQQIKELSARIRSKKLSGIGVYLDFGITKTIYNGALEIAAREVEKGSKLGNAINKAIAWVDSKIGKKWNKGLFAKHLNDKYKVTLNGKEVEVEVDNSNPTAELINGFYSPLEAGINKSKLDKATGKEWLKRVIGETEGDELKWTGVADYLTENSDKVISKNDLLDYFKTNRVQVVEVVKGAAATMSKSDARKVFEDKGYDVITDRNGDTYVEKDEEPFDYDDMSEAEQNAFDVLTSNNLDRVNTSNDTKFGNRPDLQLEGEKENYKEILVTLPLDRTKSQFNVGNKVETSYGKGVIKRIDNSSNNKPYEVKMEDGSTKYYHQDQIKGGKQEFFQSTHYEEPNILVHLRMNTRTDAEGNKVLFLEEVQSDWGQKGKKYGFKGVAPKKKISLGQIAKQVIGRLDETNAMLDLIDGDYDSFIKIAKFQLPEYADHINLDMAKYIKNNGLAAYEGKYKPTEFVDVYEEGDIFNDKTVPPSAPFVMDTNAWAKLGLKVALKEAVAQGVDKIAWTTGEQQNDRYDLSKSYRKLSITPQAETDKYGRTEENGTYLIEGIPNKGDMSGGAAMAEIADNIPLDKIEDYVGKEIAEKVKQGQEEFEGNDLKAGGKGMKGFYGSPKEGSLGIIGNLAKSLFKQEPKTVEINANDKTTQEKIDAIEKKREINGARREQINREMPQKRAKNKAEQELIDKYVKEYKELSEEFNQYEKDILALKSTQHSIDITPELKESVESGIPLFKGLTPKEQSKQRIEAAKKAFIEKSKDMSSGGFQALPEFVELIKSYIADGIITAKEFIERFKDELPGIDLNEKLAVTQFDKIYKKATTVIDETTEEVKKTIATSRVYEGNVRAGVKRELEKLGLTRDVENQQEAKERAIEFVDTVGIETALEAVRNNDVSDAAGAYVWNEILERLDRKISKEKDPTKLAELEKEQAGLFNEFSRKALSGGRFSSALADIYQNSDIGYNVENKIQEYRNANNGQISEEVEEKFRELDAQYKEVKQKLAEAEERAIKAEGELAIKNIQEAAARTPKQKVTVSSKIRTETDWIVSRVKDAQLNRPGMFLSATPASLVWDGAVKIVAGTIKVTGRSAEAIAKGLEHIVKSDWYKSLSDSDKKEAEKQFSEFWVNKETIPGIAIKIPNGLIRRLVEEGATTIEEVVEGVKDVIKEEYPDITDREIRDAITQYGKIKNLSKDEILASIRKIKRIGRIVSALEDVNNKKRPLRSGLQRDKLDAQERALNKELRELMKELPIDAELEAKQQKTALDATKQRITNQIEDLQREIDKGMRVPLSKRSMAEDAELTNLKEKRDKLKIKHNEIFKDESFLQAKRLDATKKASQRAINDLRRRLKEKDFTKKEKSPLIKDSELLNLQAEKLRLREEYDKEIYKAKLKNRTKAEKTIDTLWNTWGLTRLLRATGEFSFVGIQGLVLSISNPTYALKSFATAMKFFGSESKTENWLNMIKSQEWYPEMRQSKLSISEPRGEATAREELFLADAANFVWNILGSALKLKSKSAYDKWKNASPFKAFERAAVGYLDTMRVLKFLDGREMLHERGIRFENDPQAFKDLADVVNTFTGRASIGPLEQIAPTLTKVFFSPRNWASALKQTILFPRQLYKWRNKSGTPGVSIANKIALLDYSKFIGLTMGLVTAAAMYYSGDDDDETGVETDPTSSDFGKIKIGNTRVDPWGGRIQQIVFLARMIAGSMLKGSGEVVKLGTPYRAPTRLGLIGEQATNKLAPSAAMIQKFLTTHDKNGVTVDQWGNPYSITEELKKNAYPIYWDTVKDLLQDDPTALDGLLAFYAFFGGGVNVYDKKTKPLSNRPIKELKELKEIQEVKGL